MVARMWRQIGLTPIRRTTDNPHVRGMPAAVAVFSSLSLLFRRAPVQRAAPHRAGATPPVRGGRRHSQPPNGQRIPASHRPQRDAGTRSDARANARTDARADARDAAQRSARQPTRITGCGQPGAAGHQRGHCLREVLVQHVSAADPRGSEDRLVLRAGEHPDDAQPDQGHVQPRRGGADHATGATPRITARTRSRTTAPTPAAGPRP